MGYFVIEQNVKMCANAMIMETVPSVKIIIGAELVKDEDSKNSLVFGTLQIW